MSAATARVPARPVRPASPGPSRSRPVAPRLRVVAPRVGRYRTRLAMVCLGLLATGLVGLLMLTISLGSGGYQLAQLQRQQRDLANQRQALAEQVQEMEAPQDLAARARKLGMVPAPNTAFLQLPNGRVLGTAAAATAPPKPAPKPSPAEVRKKKKAAAAAAAKKKAAAKAAHGADPKKADPKKQEKTKKKARGR